MTRHLLLLTFAIFTIDCIGQSKLEGTYFDNRDTFIFDGDFVSFDIKSNGGLIFPINGSEVPIQITTLSKITAIATGQYSSMALKDDGTVWTWGDNTYGELGDGTNDQNNTPTQFALWHYGHCISKKPLSCPEK